MDDVVWNWLEDIKDDLDAQGESRLLELIDCFPGNKLAYIEASLPEALARARALRLPWLEVYFRHWALQARIFEGQEGASALPEAVATFEFAHREENRACPRSVCTVQDIALIYGSSDGPGWGEERLAVCTEALERINPHWGCFTCIGCEYAKALLDLERGPEAVAFLQDMMRKSRAVPGSDLYNYRHFLAMAHRLCGDLDAAHAEMDRAEVRGAHRYENDRLSAHYCTRAALFADQGRWDEVEKVLPKWKVLAPRGYNFWSYAAYHWARAVPERNDAALGRSFDEILGTYHRGDSHFASTRVGCWATELALDRGDLAAAERSLGIVDAHFPALRRPERIAALVEATRERYRREADAADKAGRSE